MPTIASGDIRKFIIINTTQYNGDGKYGVFEAGFNELPQYGLNPTLKEFQIVNTEQEISADDLAVGDIAESMDFSGAFVMRIA